MAYVPESGRCNSPSREGMAPRAPPAGRGEGGLRRAGRFAGRRIESREAVRDKRTGLAVSRVDAGKRRRAARGVCPHRIVLAS